MEPKLPKILYKYRSWQDNEKYTPENEKFQKRILTDKEIFLANAGMFNDPFDLAIPKRYDKLTESDKVGLLYSFLKQEKPSKSDNEVFQIIAEKITKGYFNDPAYWNKPNEDSLTDIKERHGVFPTAKCNDNLLMWSHYADFHRGFVVGFKSTELVDFLQSTYANEELNFGLFEVDYTNKFPVIKPSADKSEIVNNSFIRMTTKSHHWSYEEEYRYIVAGRTNAVFSIDEELYEEIVLGCKMNPNTKKDILKVVDKNFPKIKIFETIQDKTAFKIHIKQIN
jgi:hypothetical protein